MDKYKIVELSSGYDIEPYLKEHSNEIEDCISILSYKEKVLLVLYVK